MPSGLHETTEFVPNTVHLLQLMVLKKLKYRHISVRRSNPVWFWFFVASKLLLFTDCWMAIFNESYFAL